MNRLTRNKTPAGPSGLQPLGFHRPNKRNLYCNLADYHVVLSIRMSTGLNDNEIISKVLNGDQQAYAGLVNRYQNYVFTLALRMMKNREDAEEVAQDIFIKAYRYLADFRGLRNSAPGFIRS